MAKLKHAKLFLAWGLLAVLVTGCASKQPVAQLSQAQCNAIQLTNPQINQPFIDQKYWVTVSFIVANTGPDVIRDVTIDFELRGEETTIHTLTFTADVIEPFGSVTLKGSITTIRPVVYYSINLVSCRPAVERVIEEQGLSFETVDRALEAGDVELAESILERLYSSQPSEKALNSLIDVKLAAAQNAMDRGEWKTAEEKLQYTHQLEPTDPRVGQAIRTAMLKRNTLFLIIGAGVILYLVRQSLAKEN